MNDDTISRKATIDAMESIDWYHINRDGQLVHGANSKEDEPLYKASDVYKVLEELPSAQPELDKEKISDLLIRLYILGIVHLNKEGIRRRQHYCEELWKAMFHDDELPVWMHWS